MQKEKIVAILTYLIVLIFISLDMYQDFVGDESLYHILIEGSCMYIFSTLGFISIYVLLKRKRFLLSDLSQAEEMMTKLKKGLASEIDKQFGIWKLSTSEKEVAVLIIKGLSIKEICSIRSTSEKTVRTQLSSIYKKSGVNGRAELSAFFLEDLIVLN